MVDFNVAEFARVAMREIKREDPSYTSGDIVMLMVKPDDKTATRGKGAARTKAVKARFYAHGKSVQVNNDGSRSIVDTDKQNKCVLFLVDDNLVEIDIVEAPKSAVVGQWDFACKAFERAERLNSQVDAHMPMLRSFLGKHFECTAQTDGTMVASKIDGEDLLLLCDVLHRIAPVAGHSDFLAALEMLAEDLMSPDKTSETSEAKTDESE